MYINAGSIINKKYEILSVVIVSLLVVLIIFSLISPVDSSDGTVDENYVLGEPIFHYTFNNETVNDSSVLDTSGNEIHGKVTDQEQITLTSEGVYFEQGEGDIQVDLTDEEEIEDFTVVITVRNERQEFYAGIVSTDTWRVVAPYDRYGVYVSDDGIESRDNNYGSHWVQVVAVYRDGAVKFYTDGEMIGKEDVSMGEDTDTLYIGSRRGSFPFHGEIADIQMFAEPADDQEIKKMDVGVERVPSFLFSKVFSMAISIVIVIVALVISYKEYTHKHE